MLTAQLAVVAVLPLASASVACLLDLAVLPRSACHIVPTDLRQVCARFALSRHWLHDPGKGAVLCQCTLGMVVRTAVGCTVCACALMDVLAVEASV